VPAAIGSTIGLVCVAAANPYGPGMQFSLPEMLGMWVGIFVSSAIWEGVLDRTAKRRVLVVGAGAVADLQAAARRAGRLSFEMVPAGELQNGSGEGETPLIARDLAPIVEAQRPDLIVLADEHTCSQALERLLDMTGRRFHVIGLTSFYEYAFGCVPVRELTPVWFMSLLHVRQRAPRRPSKRLFDIVVAVVGLAMMLVLLPIFALAIKCTPGPVIYRQMRVGERGRHFTMYKLRTMSATAEADCGAVFAQNRDPRCTRIGRFLRRTHLDELPQLWNVLKGEMSIVGPRPIRPAFFEELCEQIPQYWQRLVVDPGMTGFAQLRMTRETSWSEKLAHDLEYIADRSVTLYLRIVAATAWRVLTSPFRALSGLSGR
jgi:exopolysaccharide biosynthesis polyprenyl glycosylphosphotransferase